MLSVLLTSLVLPSLGAAQEYSPVSEAYYDRKPFKFNGRIDTLHVKHPP